MSTTLEMFVHGFSDDPTYSSTWVDRYDGEITAPEPCCVCTRVVESRWSLSVAWQRNDDGWEYGTAGPAFCDDCARIIADAWQQHAVRT